MSQPLVLATEMQHVVLRQLTLDDAPAYFDAVERSRGHLSQFSDTTADNYPDLESVEKSILVPDNPKKLRLGIWANDEFSGSINLTPYTYDPEAEIGYWLAEDATGRGYATVSLRALVSYAEGRYPVLYASVAEGNKKSAQVLERVGFRESSYAVGWTAFKLLVPQSVPHAGA